MNICNILDERGGGNLSSEFTLSRGGWGRVDPRLTSKAPLMNKNNNLLVLLSALYLHFTAFGLTYMALEDKISKYHPVKYY